MGVIDLSVVIPCYNEAAILAQSVEELVAVLRGTRLSSELIFVDDGSSDETVHSIQACRQRYADIPTQSIHHASNMGRGRAASDGFRAANGRIVGYLDIDLEVHARYVPAMVDAIDRQGYDVAIARRIYKFARPVMFRALCSKGYHRLVRWSLGLPFEDTEAGFKFFRRESLMRVLDHVQHPGWFWDTEIMAQAWLQGLRIREIPCLFIRRTDKPSSVRVWRDSWRYLIALLTFKRRWLRCPSQTSLLYRVPWLYHGAMALVYRYTERRRLGEVVRYVPRQVSVLDVCSGDCALYHRWLKGHAADYLGVDLNPRLLHAGARRGAHVRLMDVRNGELPQADVVVMQSSLYQFIPHHNAILQKLLRAARQRVIVVEPISNWATDPRPWRRRLSHRWTNPGTGPVPERFSRPELEQLFRHYGASEIAEASTSRELIGVFDV